MTMRILSWPAKGRRPRGVLLATAAAGIAGLLAAVGPLSASGATADAHGGGAPPPAPRAARGRGSCQATWW
jgi:hypothetical protein